MILAGTILNAIFAIAFNFIDDKPIIYVLQILFPIIGLLIRKKSPCVSKIAILSGVPLAFAGIGYMLPIIFNCYVFENSFALGNTLGIIESVIAMNIRGIWYKVYLIVCQLLIKIATNPHGYFDPIASLFLVIGATNLMLFSCIYQEVLIRQDFKAVYESQEKLKQFQSLLSNDFPVGVVITSGSFDKVLYMNQYFKTHFEEKPDRVKNTVFKRFQIEETLHIFNLLKEKSIVSLWDYLEKGITDQEMKYYDNIIVLPAIYNRGGESSPTRNCDLHYEIKIRQTTWDDNPAFAIIFNDVSQKQMVTALRLADKEKDRIIATVSHELRTPINGTLGLLDMISQRVTDEESQSYLNYCKSCNKLLLYLVNSILDLSQIKQNTLHIAKEFFKLEDLLQELKSLYLFQCREKGINFEIELCHNVPKKIFTDRYRLIEILINLVGNAMKFTFQGSVTIKVCIDERDNTKLMFSVIDTGIGIREQDQGKLFQRFGKVQQENSNINKQGVGLGLAIVQELVKAMNDKKGNEKAWFQSDYGKGSSFYFRVPYMKEEEKGTINEIELLKEEKNKEKDIEIILEFPKEYEKPEETIEMILNRYESTTVFNNSFYSSHFSDKKSPKLKQSKRNKIEKFEQISELSIKNVLIVDDNPFNILAASFVVEKLQCKIDKAFHGKECIEIIQRNVQLEKYYDFILMDIQMPILDGPQTSKIINGKIKSGEIKYVPIIAVTAKKCTTEEREYYRSCGIIEVLEKPLNGDELIKVVKRYVNNIEHQQQQCLDY